MKKVFFATFLSLVSVSAYASSFSALSGSDYVSDEPFGSFYFSGKNEFIYTVGANICGAAGIVTPIKNSKNSFVLKVKGEMEGISCPNKFNGLKITILKFDKKTNKAIKIKISNSDKNANGIYINSDYL